jgi:hypothetical protein
MPIDTSYYPTPPTLRTIDTTFAGAMNPQEDDVDVIVLCGQRSPGRAIVEGAGQPRKWDEQAGVGLEGASLVGGALGLSEFSVKIQMWEARHFIEWDSFRELLKAPKPVAAGFVNGISAGIKVKALDIRHPLLDEVGVNSVVVTDRTQMQPVGDDGMWEVVISFKAYRSPKPVLVKPDGVAAAPPGDQKTIAKDQVDLEIEALTQKFGASLENFSKTKPGGNNLIPPTP